MSDSIPSDSFNLTEWLLEPSCGAAAGGKTALVADDLELTYDALRERVHACMVSPPLAGLAPGDVVGLLFERDLDAALAMLAAMRRGLVPCMLNPQQAAERIADQLTWSGAARLLHASSARALSAEAAARGIDVTEFEPRQPNDDFTRKHSANAPAPHGGDARRPAFCLFTSGTTDRPSAVLHRHSDVVTTWRNYATKVAGIAGDDVIFTSSRLFYAYGLNALFFALRAQATLVLAPERLDATTIWSVLAAKRATVMFSVPTVYHRLSNEPREVPRSLRLAVSAGEHLPDAVQQAWLAHATQPIVDGIGTTETLSTFISNRPGEVRAGSSGKLVDGFQARLVDDAGSPVAPGEPGVLWVKGDTYIDRYLDGPPGSERRFADGWFCTNDLFSEEHGGYFRYHGRASEIVKCGGVWIYPARIESVLARHEAVLDCAVAPRIQSTGLHRPVAWIVPRPGHPATESLRDALKRHCKTHLSAHEYPHFVHFIDEIPKTSSGKKMKRLLNSEDSLPGTPS